MKKFALLTNYSKDKRLVYTRMIKTYITENGGSYWIPRYISCLLYTSDAADEL